MSNLELLKQQMSKISAELSSLPPVNLSDFKMVYYRARKLDHLKREKSRLEIQIELERMNH